MQRASAGRERAQGSAGLPGSRRSLRGPLAGLPGRSRPSPRLGASASRICDALTARKPASSESLAAQTREGLQGNGEYINSSWKYQELHAEDCSHHVPHGWKTTERPYPPPSFSLKKNVVTNNEDASKSRRNKSPLPPLASLHIGKLPTRAPPKATLWITSYVRSK